VETIARLCQFEGRIVWDTSQPNGQPRRCLDMSRAEQAFGFSAPTALSDGLAQTVKWYRENRQAILFANAARRGATRQ